MSRIFFLANVRPGAKWVSKVNRLTLAAQHIRSSGVGKIDVNVLKTQNSVTRIGQIRGLEF